MKWIKTSERLPNDGERVVAKYDTGAVSDHTYYDGQKKSWISGKIIEWLDENDEGDTVYNLLELQGQYKRGYKDGYDAGRNPDGVSFPNRWES